ncbi:MAG: FAD-dependent oxidoreductase [Propioniciclava sp.]
MRTTRVETDFAVVGGGLAGVCAAIAAARQGCDVVLLQNRPVLGGNSSSEIRVWVCGATAHQNQRWARETGIIGELLEENQYRNPEGNPIYWDEVILDAVRAEPRITLLLNTDVRAVRMNESGDRIDQLTAWTMGSETTTIVQPGWVADCTGDGWLAAMSGLDCRLGKEGRDEFGEDFAPLEPVREFLGSTILFYTKDTGAPCPYVAPQSAKDITATPILTARTLAAGDNGSAYWWIEYGGHLDPVHDNADIAHELRSIIFGIWDYIKNSGQFDASTLTLEWIGALPGKREYRRIIGAHTLTQNEILNQVSFPDSIGFGGWSIDLHPVEGVYASTSGARQRFGRGLFHIPLGCLYSPKVENLLFAGRNISATHVAFGATRVMATCAVLGEAIGTVAALSRESGRTVADLASAPKQVQERLLREDASFLGPAGGDKDDLVRLARLASPDQALRYLRPPSPDLWRELDTDCALTLPGRLSLQEIRLFGTGGRVPLTLVAGESPLAVIPGSSVLARGFASLPVEPGWARAVFDRPLTFDVDSDIFLVIGASAGARLGLANSPSPLGLCLARTSDHDDQNVDLDASPLLEWPTRPFLGKSIAHDIRARSPQTGAEAVADGCQRPFGGPHMWISRDLSAGPADLVVTWDSPQTLAWLDLVFDSQLDTELNNLHRHRTPHRVIPTVARHVTILAEGEDGNLSQIAALGDNRRRHVRLPVRVRTSRVVVRIHTTHGAPEARLVSLRAYPPGIDGGQVSYAGDVSGVRGASTLAP